jgi:hypothetical protein
MIANVPSAKSINELVKDAEDRVWNSAVASGLQGSIGNRFKPVRSSPNSTNWRAIVVSVRLPWGETPCPGATAAMFAAFVVTNPLPAVSESAINTHDPPLLVLHSRTLTTGLDPPLV